ncbi:hypothetical protein IKB17_02395 [bacterium]|nr:hypothetical protein [bacterium]
MDHSENFRNFFVVITILVIGTMMFVKIGTIDLHAIWATSLILLPAVIVMGYLGQKIGEIVDNPKNRADADYKLAVLNALKKMDKSISLQELNEKLTKTVAEPDAPDIDIDEEDLDV